MENEETVNSIIDMKQISYVRLVIENFWKQWRCEYLPELKEHHRYSKRVYTCA